MIANASELIKCAQREKYALGAFNTCNLEITQAIIRAAEAKKSPAVIQVSEASIKYAGFKPIVEMIQSLINSSNVPLALHLDHGRSYEIAVLCIELGFSSIQIDGSNLSFAENVKLMKKVVKYAHKNNVFVQGEIDKTPGGHAGSTSQKEIRKNGVTDPDKAKKFIEETGVDSFAVSIGNAHGFFDGAVHLEFDVLQEIKKKINVPLVLHGGSGIPNKLIKQAIELGISKINIDSDIRFAFTYTLRDLFNAPLETIDPRDILSEARDAMQEVVERKIDVFGSAEHAN